MSTTKFKRVGWSFVQSVLEGAGSILDLGGVGSIPLKRSQMARQDRDSRAIRGDWERTGEYMRSAMEKMRREVGLSQR